MCRGLAVAVACVTLALQGRAAEKEVVDSGPRPQVVTVTQVGHDFIEGKTQGGEAIKYAVTANTQIGTVEFPQSFSAFRVGNTATVVAERASNGWEALQVIAGDQLIYFLDPKRKRPSSKAAPVRAGTIQMITAEQLVLRVAGDRDYRYVVTAKTKFGESKNPMTPAHFPLGSVAKILAEKSRDGAPIATHVLPFIQDVGSRKQAKVRQPVPDSISPLPSCRGTIVALTPASIEIRAKNGQCFKYTVMGSTLSGAKKTAFNLTQFKAGNFVKIVARRGEDGGLEATEISLADYRK